MDRLLALLFALWLGAAGVVIGFCLGGLVGPRIFGDLGGHGLGNLAHLFRGAIFGGILGLLVGIRGVLRWTSRQRGRAALWIGLAALVCAGITALLVDNFGAW